MGWRLLLVLALAIQIYADCEGRPSRDIFFLHGIASKKSAFGHFGEFLKREHKDECVRDFYFEYDTGNNKLTIEDFSKQFSDYLKSIYPYGVNNDLKISIVSHSQGGLIFLDWLISHLDKEATFDQQILSKIDSFTSISTPFYGAAIANIGRKLGVHVLPIFGKKQLEQMSFGSLFNYKLFKALANTDAKLLTYLNSLRILNVGAVVPQSSFFKKIFDTKNFEGDTAVAVSSSNINAIVGQVSQHNSNFKTIKLAPFYPVNAVHGKFTLLGVRSIARVPEDCAKGECSTPVMTLYRDHSVISDFDFIEKDISSFRVVVYLRTNQKGNKAKLARQFVPKNIELDDANFWSKFKKIDDGLYSLTFDGAFKNYKEQKTSEIAIKVINLQEDLVIKIPVEVSKTTSLEVVL